MDTAIPRKLVVILATVLFVADVAIGQTPPFSATATARKSVRVTDPITGAASLLTEDSRDLAFQEYAFTDGSGVTTYDPRYLTFATKDSSIDDVADRCTGTTYFQVYWLDDYNSSVRCISSRLNNAGVVVQGNNDSVNPRIGGPIDEEGRYVAFETVSDNLFRGKTPVPAAGEPTPLAQIVVHDRKYEQTWLSTGKNLAACYAGADRSQRLTAMSDDGSKLLFTSAAGNVINNVEPQCVPLSSFSAAQVYVRDGKNCDNPSQGGATGLGECFTSVLYDSYETHAGENTVTGLDADAENPSMTADSSVLVFDSLATTPTKYNPDVSGYYDIYLHKSNKFSVLSRMQSPRCTLTGTLLPIVNDGSPANGDSRYPRIDGPGRYVVFQSTATNLVVNTAFAGMTCSPGSTRPNSVQYLGTGGFTQIYIYDGVSKKVELVSVAYNSTSGGNGNSIKPWISRDAHYIIYESSATNLLSSATTAHRNIFMYDRVQKKTFIVTPGTGGSGLDKDASITHVSNNGLTVAFQTTASDPVAATSPNGGAVGANNTVQHVYLAQSNCPIDTDTDGVPDCLEAISKIPIEKNNSTSEFNESEIILDRSVPSVGDAAKVFQPSKESFDFPSSLVAA